MKSRITKRLLIKYSIGAATEADKAIVRNWLDSDTKEHCSLLSNESLEQMKGKTWQRLNKTIKGQVYETALMRYLATAFLIVNNKKLSSLN